MARQIELTCNIEARCLPQKAAPAIRCESYTQQRTPIYGRVAVATWKLAVERLLDEGRPVTGPNLRATLETFRQVDVEGFAAISYSPADHRPQSGARVLQLAASGRLEAIGQPLSLSLQPGWLGW